MATGWLGRLASKRSVSVHGVATARGGSLGIDESRDRGAWSRDVFDAVTVEFHALIVAAWPIQPVRDGEDGLIARQPS